MRAFQKAGPSLALTRSLVAALLALVPGLSAQQRIQMTATFEAAPKLP